MHGYKFAIRQYVIWFTVFFCLKIVEKYDICRTNVQTCIHCCSRNSVLNFSLWKNYLGNAYVPANTNILKIARVFCFSFFLSGVIFSFPFFCNFSIFREYSTLIFMLQDLSSYFVEFIRLDNFWTIRQQQYPILTLWLFLFLYFSKLAQLEWYY